MQFKQRLAVRILALLTAILFTLSPSTLAYPTFTLDKLKPVTSQDQAAERIRKAFGLGDKGSKPKKGANLAVSLSAAEMRQPGIWVPGLAIGHSYQPRPVTTGIEEGKFAIEGVQHPLLGIQLNFKDVVILDRGLVQAARDAFSEEKRHDPLSNSISEKVEKYRQRLVDSRGVREVIEIVKSGIPGRAEYALVALEKGGANFCFHRGEVRVKEPILDKELITTNILVARGFWHDLENNSFTSIIDSESPVYLVDDNTIKFGEEMRTATFTCEKIVRGETVEEIEIKVEGDDIDLILDYLETKSKTEQAKHAYIEKNNIANEEGLKEAQRKQRKIKQETLGSLVARELGEEVNFRFNLLEDYLGGEDRLEENYWLACKMRKFQHFIEFFRSPELQAQAREFSERLQEIIEKEEKKFDEAGKELRHFVDIEAYKWRIMRLKDIEWIVRTEILGLIDKIKDLGNMTELSDEEFAKLPESMIRELYSLRILFMMFNSVDKRGETRGRDSCGISFTLAFRDNESFQDFLTELGASEEITEGLDFDAANLRDEFEKRQNPELIPNLINYSIRIRPTYDRQGNEDNSKPVAVTFIYKTAKRVGPLGRNIEVLTNFVKKDRILQRIIRRDFETISGLIHTRWASAGIISEENCHPIANQGLYTLETKDEQEFEMIWQLPIEASSYGSGGNISVVLNGDIENFKTSHVRDLIRFGIEPQEIKQEDGTKRKETVEEVVVRNVFFPDLTDEYEDIVHLPEEVRKGIRARRLPPDITTDTLLIPLRIEYYLAQGNDLFESTRKACADFNGSFAIQVQSDLEPGKLIVANYGENQDLYIGFSDEGIHPASEIYGFVDLTQDYIKLDNKGTVVEIDPAKPLEPESLRAERFNGETVSFTTKKDLKRTTITSRDVDIKGYEHFIEKEIAEGADMWDSTIMGKFVMREEDSSIKTRIDLDESELPRHIIQKLKDGKIKRIVFTGMGTAYAAGIAIAEILRGYLRETGHSSEIEVIDAVATELSAFEERKDLSDTLIIAISQSGTTSDTNNYLEAAKKKGAHLLGIINRRDTRATTIITTPKEGDVSGEVGGIYYTGMAGRDVEIAVASTKAYYAQIAAGTLYSMVFAKALGIDEKIIAKDLEAVEKMSELIRKFLNGIETQKEDHPLIRAANFMPLMRESWKVHGTGGGYISAEEARIKISELCYHSVVRDMLEQGKHIDFSAEFFTLVNLANLYGEGGKYRTDASGEIDKMNSHEILPVLVVDEDDHRYDGKSATIVKPDGEKVNIILGDKDEDYIIRVPIISDDPKVCDKFAPVLLSLAAHEFAYYTALAMNRRADEISETVEQARERENRIREVIEEKRRLSIDLSKQELSEEGMAKRIVTEPEYLQGLKNSFEPIASAIKYLGTWNAGGMDAQYTWIFTEFYNLFVNFLPECEGNIREAAEKAFFSDELVTDERFKMTKYNFSEPALAQFAEERNLSRYDMDGVTAIKILDDFEAFMASLADALARTVDAIRHQAKVVTVGTKRAGEIPQEIIDLMEWKPDPSRAGVADLRYFEKSQALKGYVGYKLTDRYQVRIFENADDSKRKSEIIVVGKDRVGLLEDVAKIITENGINIVSHEGVPPFIDTDGKEISIMRFSFDVPVSEITKRIPQNYLAGILNDIIQRPYLTRIKPRFYVAKKGGLIGTEVDFSKIDPTAIIEKGSIVVGEDTELAAGARITKKSHVENCKIDEGAVVEASNLDSITVKKGAKVRFSVCKTDEEAVGKESWELGGGSPYKVVSQPTVIQEGALVEYAKLLNATVKKGAKVQGREYGCVIEHSEIGEGTQVLPSKIVLAKIGKDNIVGNFDKDGNVTGIVEVTDFVGGDYMRIGRAGRGPEYYREYMEGFYLNFVTFERDLDGNLEWKEIKGIPQVVMMGRHSIALEFSGFMKPEQEIITSITGREPSDHGLLVFAPFAIIGGGAKVIGAPSIWKREGLSNIWDIIEKYDRTYLFPFSFVAPGCEFWGVLFPFSRGKGKSSSDEDIAWLLDHAPDAIFESLMVGVENLPKDKRDKLDGFIENNIHIAIDLFDIEQEKLKERFKNGELKGKEEEKAKARIAQIEKGIKRLKAHLDSGAWKFKDGKPIHWEKKDEKWNNTGKNWIGNSNEVYSLVQLLQEPEGKEHPGQDWYSVFNADERKAIEERFAFQQRERRIHKGEGVDIHPTAVVDPRASILDGAKIGADVVVGSNVEIGKEDEVAEGANISGASILCDRVRVGKGSKHWHSRLRYGAKIGDNANLDMVIVDKKIGPVGVDGASEIGDNVSLSFAKVETRPGKRSIVGNGTTGTTTLVSGSEVGEKTKLLAFSRVVRSKLGRNNEVGSRLVGCGWGNNIRNGHLFTQLAYERTVPLEVKVGERKATLHCPITHGAGTAIFGTDENPVEAGAGSFFGGGRNIIGKGAKIGHFCFVKEGLNEAEVLAPFTFSFGLGIENKELGGVLSRLGPSYVFRHLLSYTFKTTSKEDRWAVGYVVEKKLIELARWILGELTSYTDNFTNETQGIANETGRLTSRVQRDFLKNEPTSVLHREQILNSIKTIVGLIEKERQKKDLKKKGKYSWMQLLNGLQTCIENLDGRWKLRYYENEDALIFTEGKWIYEHTPTKGEYKWIPAEREAMKTAKAPEPLSPGMGGQSIANVTVSNLSEDVMDFRLGRAKDDQIERLLLGLNSEKPQVARQSQDIIAELNRLGRLKPIEDFTERFVDYAQGAAWRGQIDEITKPDDVPTRIAVLKKRATDCALILEAVRDQIGLEADIPEEIDSALIVLPADVVLQYGAELPQLARKIYEAGGMIGIRELSNEQQTAINKWLVESGVEEGVICFVNDDEACVREAQDNFNNKIIYLLSTETAEPEIKIAEAVGIAEAEDIEFKLRRFEAPRFVTEHAISLRALIAEALKDGDEIIDAVLKNLPPTHQQIIGQFIMAMREAENAV